jgi:chemotaxis protein histidine kinase CheA
VAHDVFISYSSLDKTAADAVRGAIESRGIRCWIDHNALVLGEQWEDEIPDAIASSQVMVLLISSHSNGSGNVKNELSCAVAAKIHIIPVRIENVELRGSFKLNFTGRQILDAFNQPIEPHLERLADAVSKRVKQIEAAREIEVLKQKREAEHTTGETTVLRLRRETEHAAAEAVLKQKRETEHAAAEAALKQKRETEHAAAEAALKQKRDAEHAAAEAVALKQKRDTEHAVAEAASLKQKRESELAVVEATAKQKRDAEHAAAEAVALKQKRESELAAAEAALKQKRDAQHAAAEAAQKQKMDVRQAEIEVRNLGEKTAKSFPVVKVAGLLGLVVVIAAVAFLVTRPASQVPSNPEPPIVRFNDPRLSACSREPDPSTCQVKKANADRLTGKSDSDWGKISWDDPILQDCMGYDKCLQAKAMSDSIQAITKAHTWANRNSADPVFKNCMRDQRCLDASKQAKLAIKPQNKGEDGSPSKFSVYQ